MRRTLLTMIVMLGVLCQYIPAFAGGGGGGGTLLGPASEFTQVLNNIELISSVAKQAEMVANQIRMIQYQIEQLKSIERYPGGVWNDAMTAIRKLDLIVRQGQALSYTLQNIEQEFKRKYPGYEAPQDFIQSYQDWSKTTLDSIRTSLEAAGFQSNEFQTESATLQTIQNLSDNAIGQTQAIQASNMIASEEVQQLQKLRQLHMSQMQAANAYMSYEVNKDASTNAALDEFINVIEYNGGGNRY